MDTQKSILIKKRVDILIKNNKDISPTNKRTLFFNKINKTELEYLINNREYCKKILTEFSLDFSESMDSMWRGRAQFFINTLIDIFFDNQKRLYIKITIPIIRYYLSLDNIVDLLKFFEMNNIKVDKLKKYLTHIPGYQNINNISVNSYEQQGFLSMQFTESFNSFSSFYQLPENLFRVETLNIIKKLENF
jgi:hypothetical protein